MQVWVKKGHIILIATKESARGKIEGSFPRTKCSLIQILKLH